jgi:hypothetical protein
VTFLVVPPRDGLAIHMLVFQSILQSGHSMFTSSLNFNNLCNKQNVSISRKQHAIITFASCFYKFFSKCKNIYYYKLIYYYYYYIVRHL